MSNSTTRNRRGPVLLKACADFMPRDESTTTGNASFEQADYLSFGQVRVNLSSYPKEPLMHAFAGARGSSEQVSEEWRKSAVH